MVKQRNAWCRTDGCTSHIYFVYIFLKIYNCRARFPGRNLIIHPSFISWKMLDQIKLPLVITAKKFVSEILLWWTWQVIRYRKHKIWRYLSTKNAYSDFGMRARPLDCIKLATVSGRSNRITRQHVWISSPSSPTLVATNKLSCQIKQWICDQFHTNYQMENQT